ncbi:hypothetical protein DPMN_049645 [Dreissena polymorpha]|uniref:Acetyl-CoA carboxylase central domain-containing protein n=1 Tax=Dreissena polymorpha TaxID=45954 RepID=A0A9D4HMD3_DREPO|nr:hypothetical protein DPMN_049645 [Dreissena polymorpha]
MLSYENNLTSVLCQFPSQQIANVIDGHAATLTRRPERDAFFMNTQGIVELIQRFVPGILYEHTRTQGIVDLIQRSVAVMMKTQVIVEFIQRYQSSRLASFYDYYDLFFLRKSKSIVSNRIETDGSDL